LKTFDALKGLDPKLQLIISPRHIERTAEIKELVSRFGGQPVALSALNGTPLTQQQVLIVDRIGVLKDLYSIADIVFIGKTLAVGGGQNMIEPAFFSKPIVVGPLTANFKDVVRIFLAEQALIQVDDEQGLLKALTALIQDPGRAQTIGRRAFEVVRKYQGATVRTLEHLKPIMERLS
jgi:3-deoxy-D-manno-octulosonic-acid transferase